MVGGRRVGIAVLVLLGGCGRWGFEMSDRVGGGDDGGGDDSGAPISGFSQLDVMGESTCGVMQGRAYCWGANDEGQLGIGDTNDRAAPAAVAIATGTVTQIDVGVRHACAIVDAVAWCWGGTALGGGASTSEIPVRVSSLPSPVTRVSAGYDFTCAIAAGDLYCWGDDAGGRLGNGAGPSSEVPVMVLAGPVADVAAGGDHACAVKGDGSAWCWGHNDGPGALGQGTTVGNTDAPGQVVDQTAFTAVSLGGYSGCGISGGGAWCWGTGESGELGNGAAASSTRPVAVSGLDQAVTAIHTGGGPSSADASCALRDDAMWCWGSGLFGRLGNRTVENLVTPAEVIGLTGPVTAMSIGWFHTCAVVGDGDVACWGRGDRGELGDGGMATSYEPVMVTLPTQ